MNLNVYLIEPASEFLNLLCRPVTTYFNTNVKNTLYKKWKYNFIDLYNNRAEFLCMAHTDIKDNNSHEKKILESSYYDNYLIVNKNFNYISNTIKLWDNHISLNEDHFIMNMDDMRNTPYNNELIYNLIEKEKTHKKLIELNMFRFMVFVYQYLNVFDERSININLWNYCLRSSTFSYKCFFLGIFTLLIQYIWVSALLFDVSNKRYNNSDDDDVSSRSGVGIIMVIAILSTILSLMYSYNTIKSYYYSRYLYTFLIKVYDDYPELSLSRDDKSLLYYKKRNINMKKYHIKYNWWADFLSNFILPLGIPIINFFIIQSSESVIDAILNSVAIFFIVQIDEDLYNYSDYDKEKNTINFTRWFVSVIYCKHFPLLKDIFQLECETWFSKIFNLTKKFKHKHNKIGILVND